MFWFKRKKIVVDCFTQSASVYGLYKPQEAIKFIPDGWKTLPKSVKVKPYEQQDPESRIEVDSATLKKCIGFINLFRNGFIIPNWCDVKVEIKSDGNFTYHAGGDFFANQHPNFQKWQELYEDYGHAKFASPWLLHEKSGVQFTWNQCDWHKTDVIDKFKIVSGVVDYKYQHQTNINMFIKKNTVLEFNAGEPMVHLIPISDREIQIKTHLLDPAEFIKINRRPIHYMNQYNTWKKTLDANSKCPFGFGK